MCFSANCEDMQGNIADVAGQAFLFSPNGQYIAIWNTASISIYRIRQDYQLFIPPTEPILEISASDLVIGQGTWSPDSTWFAYSDSEGLWLKDLLQPESESKLLIPTASNGIPLAHHYSEQGRYIFVIQGDEQVIYDTRTDTILPNTPISPDDTLLVNYKYETITEDGFAKWFWLDYRTAIFMEEYYDSAYLIIGKVYSDYVFVESLGVSDAAYGIDFDYESITGSILVHNDATHISIDTRTLDLAPYLDGDIVSVEWLPIVWYEE